jgi:hypothetical protein
MSHEWIIRVEGKEYGPVTLQVLREWKEEGRVLAANEARRTDVEVWKSAAQIPGLFESDFAPPVQTDLIQNAAQTGPPLPERSFASLCQETFRIYATGIWQFSLLALLVIIPSACAQLTSVALDSSAGIDNSFRAVLAGAFAFCMFLLLMLLWPVYVAGIQILAAELAAGRTMGFFAVLNNALKCWPRVAVLSLIIYGIYFILTVLLILVIGGITLGTPSFTSIFLALLLLAFWVWIIGRLFVNFLFWPQFAVLEGSKPQPDPPRGPIQWLLDLVTTLRRSKELARSGRELPWHKRPLWRGVFLASIWFAFVLVLDVGSSWTALRQYFHAFENSPNPEAMVETLKTVSTGRSFEFLAFALGLWQGLMRPLLGIAFVVLYFDCSSRNHQS